MEGQPRHTKPRSNSDPRLSNFTVLLPTSNADIFVKLNDNTSNSTSVMQKVTRNQLHDIDRITPLLADGRVRSNSNAQEYGSTTPTGTPCETPLTPKRKQLIVLQGTLLRKVQQQLRQAWPGAWFALHADRAFLRTYHSIRKYRQPQKAKDVAKDVAPTTPPRHRPPPAIKNAWEDVEEEIVLTQSLSSTATVFVLVTNMFSGGLLVIPYAFCQSGLIGGICITLVMAAVCCYTSLILIRLGTALQTSDFGQIFGIKLGKQAKVLTSLSSIFLFTAVLSAYHTFVTGTLQAILSVSFSRQIPAYPCALGFVFFCLPPACLKDQTLVSKCSSLGFVWILWVAVYVVVQAREELRAPQSGAQAVKLWDTLGLLTSAPGVIVGVFSCHAYVLVILGQKSKRATHLRDVKIAFAIVAALVIMVGILSVVAWSRRQPGVPQNLFSAVFLPRDTYSLSAMVAAILAMTGSYLSILNVQQISVFTFFTNKSDTYISFRHTFGFKASMMIITTLLAIFYPNGGSILGLGCAGASVIQVFGLPCAIQLKAAMETAKKQSESLFTRSLSWSIFHAAVVLFGFACFACSLLPFLIN